MNEAASNTSNDTARTDPVAARPLISQDAIPAARVPLFPRMSRKLRNWLRTLHHDPTAEERAADERRARLLDELNRAVSDAPEDMPLRDVISRINKHYSD
ncbi:MAG: hypothetical protein H7145_25445 [Akkermansiaceae bacterium]|nr:hypothetical protein [Armatimonadota bacterium]